LLGKKISILVTGGAGFVGCNLVHSFLVDGYSVKILDNLSRKGSERNLKWLRGIHNNAFSFVQGDIRNAMEVRESVATADVIFHLGAQVAVTSSLEDPRTDFETNALGTLNVLEAARLSVRRPFVLLTSTNKVYGDLNNVPVVEGKTRYTFRDCEGIGEDHPLDFHSPYGCSKGAADQYVHDYGRIYGLPTVVFRMSCIYGTRQFGNEDQGWVAHFMISHALGRPITIYGNGKQVRDILFVDDLIRAFRMCLEKPEVVAGQIYNIGGGPENTISIWLEMKDKLRVLTGLEPTEPPRKEWRSGDQPIYISDISKAQRDFGWQPKISVNQGMKKLHDWIEDNRSLFVSTNIPG